MLVIVWLIRRDGRKASRSAGAALSARPRDGQGDVEPVPEQTADSYLEAAARRAGILEERGTDIFAFWHPTFEEYLAGVDLTTPSSRAAERLVAVADDPRWREVVLLGVG
jgi:hypothetical protein